MLVYQRPLSHICNFHTLPLLGVDYAIVGMPLGFFRGAFCWCIVDMFRSHQNVRRIFRMLQYSIFKSPFVWFLTKQTMDDGGWHGNMSPGSCPAIFSQNISSGFTSC